MIGESHKHLKKIIIIGVIVLLLAVLSIIFLPLIKEKIFQTPTANLPTSPRDKIQKELDQLIEARRNQNEPILSAEEIQKDMDKLVEKARASGVSKSSEEVKKDTESLKEFKQ